MSKEPTKSREEILAAREAKKLAKLKAKGKTQGNEIDDTKNIQAQKEKKTVGNKTLEKSAADKTEAAEVTLKDKDEVDRAVVSEAAISSSTAGKSKNGTKKEATKQAEAVEREGDILNTSQIKSITKKSVSETLNKIADAAKEVKELSARLDNIKVNETIDTKINEIESAKSKAELKAERRAKQEAQRAAKLAQNAVKENTSTKPLAEKAKQDKNSVKIKVPNKVVKTKSQSNLEAAPAKKTSSLLNIGINNPKVHPAIVKLGVQVATGTVRGSNARSVALLSALKQVVRDYSLPAETEFARGLESTLSSNLEFLWTFRPPATTQTNAIKYFRYQLTQLPNNINEFDAKEILQDAIDTYIREQIDMAGQAISLSVRKKISSRDCILTFGWSSLVERILLEAWGAGLRFRVVVAGGVTGCAREVARRLRASNVPVRCVQRDCVYDIMPKVDKVLLGAAALLVNGWVVTGGGAGRVCRAARHHNVPVLVCAERHKVSERVHTDPFFCTRPANPEWLDESNEYMDSEEPLYDVIPPTLVTAVVTELAILPCSSAPVVLRFMLSEYGF